jgi:hypothetical protein
LGGAHKGFGEANLKNKGLRGANLENKGFGGANLIKKPLLTQKRSKKGFIKVFPALRQHAQRFHQVVPH